MAPLSLGEETELSVLFRLREPWALSTTAAAVNLLSTLIIVWQGGAITFANYAVDMAKLSIVVLLLETLPSPYAILKAQQDETLKQDLASFALFGGAVAIALTTFLGALHLFEGYSNWIPVYAAYLAAQRYFDIKFQAEGRLKEYFQITLGAVSCRIILLLAGFGLFEGVSGSNIVWASISIGSLCALLLWLAFHRVELDAFLRRGHWASAVRLFEARRAYAPYYLNVSLKRVRDSAMPILCGALVTDPVQVARYLLAYRGVDFVCGQLRLLEALLANLKIRQELRLEHGSFFLLLAGLGQVAAFAGSAFLASQVSFDLSAIALSLLASLLVYPYTFELVGRSNAYAQERPWLVTRALTAYIVGLVVVVVPLATFGALSAETLILAPLSGQIAAALTYPKRAV